jgi:hypothetical protein
MAWKVYGFMEGRDAVGKCPALYGPLPRKRWIPAPGDKKRRVAVSNGFKAPIFDKADQARKAVEYARWLAARDDKALPVDATVSAIWDSVTLPTGKLQSRVRAVSFAGRPAGFIIDIPNWDFIPAAPVFEVDPEYFRDLLTTPCPDDVLDMVA